MICEKCKAILKQDEDGGYLEECFVFQRIENKFTLCDREMKHGFPLYFFHTECKPDKCLAEVPDVRRL